MADGRDGSGKQREDADLDPAREGAAGAPGPGRRRRWPWLVSGLALLAVVGLRPLLPLLIERGGAWGARQYLGLPLRIENVDLALLRGRILLEGLDVGARSDAVAPLRAALGPPRIAPEAALLHVERIGVALSWAGLWNRAVRLSEVAIESPVVRLVREADGTIDPLRHAMPVAGPGAPDPPAEVGAETADPWTLAVDRFELRSPDVRILDGGSGEDLVGLSLDALSLSDLRVDDGDVSLGDLGIQGPALRIARAFLVGRPATQQVAAPEPPSAPATARAAPTAEPAAPPSYHVDHVDLEDATFELIGERGAVQAALGLRASDVSADEGRRFPLELEVEVGEGALRVAGEIGVSPPSFGGQLAWEGLPGPVLLLGAVPELSSWLRSGSYNGTLEVDADLGSRPGPPGVRIAGRTWLDGLELASPGEEEVSLGWSRLEVAIRELWVPLPVEGSAPGPPRVHLDAVRLVEPRVLFTTPSPQLDALRTASAVEGAEEEASGSGSQSPAEPSAAVDLAIGEVELTDGELVLVDHGVQPSVRAAIRELGFRARDVSFPELQALAVRLEALLPEQAKLDLHGDLHPGRGDFELRLDRLALPVFGPYAKAAGARLERGAASLETRARLRGRRIELDNDLVLRQLSLSLGNPAGFEQRFGVPFDLALALLRDPKGDISLSVPVAFESDRTDVDLTAIVASALRQALTGALTAPLKLAGAGISGIASTGLVPFAGGGGRSNAGGGLAIDRLPSLPGSIEPAPSAEQQLAGLRQLLAERPGLSIVLGGTAGPDDRPGLAREILAEQRGELPAVAGGERRSVFRRLLDRIRRLGWDRDGERADAAELEKIDVPEARLRSLATRRAERLRALLVESGVDPERVRVGEPATDGAPGVAVVLAAG